MPKQSIAKILKFVSIKNKNNFIDETYLLTIVIVDEI